MASIGRAEAGHKKRAEVPVGHKGRLTRAISSRLKRKREPKAVAEESLQSIKKPKSDSEDLRGRVSELQKALEEKNAECSKLIEANSKLTEANSKLTAIVDNLIFGDKEPQEPQPATPILQLPSVQFAWPAQHKQAPLSHPFMSRLDSSPRPQIRDLARSVRFQSSALKESLEQQSPVIKGPISAEKYTTLTQAALEGDSEGVEMLLKSGNFTIDQPTEQGESPLMMVVFKDHLSAAQLLLGKGADVNYVAREGALSGWTPLTTAALHSTSVKLVQLLLDRGANVNYASPEGQFKGWTALMLAIVNDNSDIVECLLDNKADVNCTVLQETTKSALMLAVLVGNEKIVQLLLDHGADIDFICPEVPHEGRTALDFANEDKRPGIIALLKKAKQDKNS